MLTWSLEEDTLLKSYYKIKSKQDLLTLLAKRSWGAIKRRSYILGIVRNRWEEWEDTILLKNYSLHSLKEVQGLLPHRTVSSIRVRGLFLGLSHNKSIVKSKSIRLLFESITSEEEAYILGFLAADANLKRDCLTLCLAEKDGEHVFFIRESIGMGNIKYKKVRSKTEQPKIYGQYQLTLCNRVLSENLQKWGIIENKSFKLNPPPSLNSKLIRHWIRGYFDGDGCVTQNKKQPMFNVLGTKEVMQFILDEFKKTGVITKMQVKPYKNIFKLANCSFICLYFLEWLYKDSDYYLDRKYQKYLAIKKKYEGKQK